MFTIQTTLFGSGGFVFLQQGGVCWSTDDNSTAIKTLVYLRTKYPSHKHALLLDGFIVSSDGLAVLADYILN